MCFGFLAAFEEDSKALREHIDSLDRALQAEDDKLSVNSKKPVGA